MIEQSTQAPPSGDEQVQDSPGIETIFIGIRTRLFIGLTLVFTIILAGIFYWVYTFIGDFSESKIMKEMENTLNGAAAGVDVEELLALIEEGEPNDEGLSDDPRFENQMNWLDAVHKVEPHALLYIYKKGPTEYDIIWVIDLYAVYSPGYKSAFMELSEGDTDSAGWRGFEEFSYKLDDKGKLDDYVGEFGEYAVSAYRPIENDKGEKVAAIGVDYDGYYINEIRDSIKMAVIMAFAISYIALFIAIFAISGALTHRILTLTEIAEKIGEGDYEQDLSPLMGGRFRDETGKLSEVFKIMVRKVDKREQRLRMAAGPAIIEINEEKSREQAREIMETPFFQELQALKARERKHGEDKKEGK